MLERRLELLVGSLELVYLGVVLFLVRSASVVVGVNAPPTEGKAGKEYNSRNQ